MKHRDKGSGCCSLQLGQHHSLHFLWVETTDCTSATSCSSKQSWRKTNPLLPGEQAENRRQWEIPAPWLLAEKPRGKLHGRGLAHISITSQGRFPVSLRCIERFYESRKLPQGHGYSPVRDPDNSCNTPPRRSFSSTVTACWGVSEINPFTRVQEHLQVTVAPSKAFFFPAGVTLCLVLAKEKKYITSGNSTFWVCVTLCKGKHGARAISGTKHRDCLTSTAMS